VVYIGATDEGGYFDGLVAVRDCRFHLLGFQDNELILSDFIAPNLLVPVDRLAGLAIDELPMNAMPVSRLMV
jgi:hypothetical protein